MGVYLRDNMGCMTDFGYVILATNLPTFMTIQAVRDIYWYIHVDLLNFLAPRPPPAGRPIARFLAAAARRA